MNKPNFIGIGGVRCGSTWLHNLLNSHPQIYLPEKRKEIQYFTRFHDKGEEWYYKWFESSNNFKWKGEITPGYLIAEKCAEYIRHLGSVEKLVLIVRDPVERTISHYSWHVKVSGEKIDFKTFYTRSVKLAIENGMYYKYLKSYLDHFSKDQIKVLIFEEVTKDIHLAIHELSEFFDIDSIGFDSSVKQVNQSSMPRSLWLVKVSGKIVKILRQNGLDQVIFSLRKLGKAILFRQNEKVRVIVTEDDRKYLAEIFKNDKKELEEFIGREINCWPNFY